MLFAVFIISRETMVGTDDGCKVLSKFSSPYGATVKAETDVLHNHVNAVPFCSECSPNNLHKRNPKLSQCLCMLMFH